MARTRTVSRPARHKCHDAERRSGILVRKDLPCVSFAQLYDRAACNSGRKCRCAYPCRSCFRCIQPGRDVPWRFGSAFRGSNNPAGGLCARTAIAIARIGASVVKFMLATTSEHVNIAAQSQAGRDIDVPAAFILKPLKPFRFDPLQTRVFLGLVDRPVLADQIMLRVRRVIRPNKRSSFVDRHACPARPFPFPGQRA